MINPAVLYPLLILLGVDSTSRSLKDALRCQHAALHGGSDPHFGWTWTREACATARQAASGEGQPGQALKSALVQRRVPLVTYGVIDDVLPIHLLLLKYLTVGCVLVPGLTSAAMAQTEKRILATAANLGTIKEAMVNVVFLGYFLPNSYSDFLDGISSIF